MTLTEFLLARLADDEAALSAVAQPCNTWWVDGPARTSGKWWIYDAGAKFERRADAEFVARHGPARIEAECAAKRRIVESETERQREQWKRRADEHRLTFGEWQALWPSGILRDLAAVYADHPDYDQAWRP